MTLGSPAKLIASLDSFVTGNRYDSDEFVGNQCAKVCFKISFKKVLGINLVIAFVSTFKVNVPCNISKKYLHALFNTIHGIKFKRYILVLHTNNRT